MIKMKIYNKKQKRPEEIIQVIENMPGSYRMMSLILSPHSNHPPTSQEVVQEFEQKAPSG